MKDTYDAAVAAHRRLLISTILSFGILMTGFVWSWRVGTEANRIGHQLFHATEAVEELHQLVRRARPPRPDSADTIGIESHGGIPLRASVPTDRETERRLFLTPGGRYTEADIRANGATTPWAKYGSEMAAHSLTVRPGDPVCPITRTRANPRFTWIVGGKPYLFCCPPCIAEFVKRAKEKPDSIRPPDEYVQRPAR